LDGASGIQQEIITGKNLHVDEERPLLITAACAAPIAISLVAIITLLVALDPEITALSLDVRTPISTGAQILGGKMKAELTTSRPVGEGVAVKNTVLHPRGIL